MLSFRFAKRLRLCTEHLKGHSSDPTDYPSKVATRERDLLETCMALLQELREMGGHDHAMIRGTVHDLIAQTYLRPLAANTAARQEKTKNKTAVDPSRLHEPRVLGGEIGAPFAPIKSEDKDTKSEVGLLMGWPGRAAREALEGVEIAALDKATTHFAQGLLVVESILDSSKQGDVEEMSDEESDVEMQESVRAEARRLRLNLLDVSLVTASRYVDLFRASSAIDKMRDAANHLASLQSHGNQATQDKTSELASWFWMLGGRLSRAVASDRFAWVDKAGIHPQDVIAFLAELDDIVQVTGRKGPFSPPASHSRSALKA